MALRPRLAAALLLFSCALHGAPQGPPASSFAELLRDPTPAEWRALSRFGGTLTERDFEGRLDRIFDPGRGLQPYLRLGPDSVEVYPAPDRRGAPMASVRFATGSGSALPLAVPFRTPGEFRRRGTAPDRPPLQGLRVAIEPADFRKGIDGLVAVCRQRLGAEVVLKPNDQGSSVGLALASGEAELKSALVNAWKLTAP